MPRPKVTADQMRRALYSHFIARYAVVFEVTARPEPLPDDTIDAYRRGEIRYADLRAAGGSERRIDALLVRRTPRAKRAPTPAAVAAYRIGQGVPHTEAMFEVPGERLPADLRAPIPPTDGGLERVAIEIKVSRGDFLTDIRCPEKQAPWRELAERHAYAVPAGLVAPGEVPADSGLIEVRFDTERWSPEVKWTRRAPRGTATPLPVTIQLDAFYRWSRAEALTRGLAYDTRKDDDPEVMRAELARLRHALELAENRIDQEREKTDMWRTRCAALGRPACSTCGKPLYAGRDRWRALSWKHNEADETTCKVLRTAAAMQRDGDNFIEHLVPGPEPDYDSLGKSCRESA